jgi:hypothetical protein
MCGREEIGSGVYIIPSPSPRKISVAAMRGEIRQAGIEKEEMNRANRRHV